MAVNPSDTLVDNIKNTYLAKSPIHGTGLFAALKMEVGDILGKLEGVKMPWALYEALGLDGFVDYEWNALPDDWLLVRTKKTKYAAINHSREPNLRLIPIEDYKREVMVIRPIGVGEELLLDYRAEPLPKNYIKSHGWAYL